MSRSALPAHGERRPSSPPAGIQARGHADPSPTAHYRCDCDRQDAYSLDSGLRIVTVRWSSPADARRNEYGRRKTQMQFARARHTWRLGLVDFSSRQRGKHDRQPSDVSLERVARFSIGCRIQVRSPGELDLLMKIVGDVASYVRW
jgi:hypothetical protein